MSRDYFYGIFVLTININNKIITVFMGFSYPLKPYQLNKFDLVATILS
ncbi:MAG: hypothetical protein ACOCRX_05885 [Candidatus Woesearchaeota archaeon]